MAAGTIIPPPTSGHIETQRQSHGEGARAGNPNTGRVAGTGHPDALLAQDIRALDVPIFLSFTFLLNLKAISIVYFVMIMKSIILPLSYNIV